MPSKFAQAMYSLRKEMLTQAAKCSRMEKSNPIEKKANNPKVQTQRLRAWSLGGKQSSEQIRIGTKANIRTDCYAKDGIISGSITVKH